MAIDHLEETPVPDAEDEPNTGSAIEEHATAANVLDGDEDEDETAADGSSDEN